MGCASAHRAAVDVDEPQKRQKDDHSIAVTSNPVQPSKSEGPRVAGASHESGEVSKQPSLPTLPPPPVINGKSEDAFRKLPELPPIEAEVPGAKDERGICNMQQTAHEAPQSKAASDRREDRLESVPGAICTTPRGRKPQHEIESKSSGKTHIGRAFDALGSGEPEAEPKIAGSASLGKAFAALGEESDDEEEAEGQGLLAKCLVPVVPLSEEMWKGTSRPCVSPVPQSDWPREMQVSTEARVLVLTWARWARNSLRIKDEIKFKALQHIKYPKTPYRPLSPQPTPRGNANDGSGESQDFGRLPAAPDSLQDASRNTGSSKRYPAMAPRNRGAAPQGRLLFDVMAEERRDASEAEGVRLKLEKMAIEERHTESSTKTPGFGVETPNFLEQKSSASRMSPMDSIASSGVGSPLAAGQLSPWLLEAEALVTEEDEQTLDCPPPTKTKAWFHPPSQLFDLPEVSEVNELLDGDLDEFIDDEDELDKVVMFSTAGVSGETGSDSLASTATSPAMPSGVFGGNLEKKAIGDLLSSNGHQQSASGSFFEPSSYAIGEKVSYWSGSRGVWLPAVIVEKKSDSVYLIDKQMKGCLAKVRTSELISRSEEKRDPILAAFTSLERDSGSTPRGGKSPRKAGSTPRGSRSQPNGEKAGSRPSSGIGSERRGSRELPPLQHERTSPRNYISSSKAPTVIPEVPRALAQMASTSPAGTPRSRGKIVRDDFSDDSDDD